MSDGTKIDTVVLDLDGTLVDSVYHHVIAWHTAFREVGVEVPATHIHGAIGMGGDRLVGHLAGDSVESAVGDTVRSGHDRHFRDALRHVHPLDGAGDLIQFLSEQELHLTLASSGSAEMTEELLSLVDNRWLLQSVISGSDADASKPAPDLITQAVTAVGGSHPVAVGDAVWDMRAAAAAGVPAIGLLSGGVCRDQLLASGAASVSDGPRALIREWTRAVA